MALDAGLVSSYRSMEVAGEEYGVLWARAPAQAGCAVTKGESRVWSGCALFTLLQRRREESDGEGGLRQEGDHLISWESEADQDFEMQLRECEKAADFLGVGVSTMNWNTGMGGCWLLAPSLHAVHIKLRRRTHPGGPLNCGCGSPSVS